MKRKTKIWHWPRRCNCIGSFKGRPLHEIGCWSMGERFYAEDLLEQFPGRWKREDSESVDDCIDRILKDYWGIYYLWRNTEETGSD